MIRLVFKAGMVLFLMFCILFTSNILGEAGYVPDPNYPQMKNINTVEEAKRMPDDTWVVLHGYIESHIRLFHYVFRDETGSITVEIDDDKWRGQVVGPRDKVEIEGEVDRDPWSLEIEVKRIRKIEQQAQ